MRVFLICLVIFGVVSFSHQDETIAAARTFGARNLPCGTISRSKQLTITNPSQLPKECIYRIQPSSQFVCQIRIDFDVALNRPALPVDSPTSVFKVPKCDKDVFYIGGLEICGVNRNQHMYLPFNTTRANMRETLELKFKIADRFADSTLGFVAWNLRIQQLECPNGAARSMPSMNSLQRGVFPEGEALNPFTARTIFRDGFLLAPHGCTQYFPQPEGFIETFNYNGGSGPYLPNLDYAICFRRRAADTKITLTFESFAMSSGKPAEAGYDLNCFPQTAAADAGDDFLLVPYAVTPENLRVTRVCGNTVNTKTIALNPPGPISIRFHSDNKYDAKVFTEAGFRIKYKIE